MIYILQSDRSINGVFTGEDGFKNLIESFEKSADIAMKFSASWRPFMGPEYPLFLDSHGEEVGTLKASKYTDEGKWEMFDFNEKTAFRNTLHALAKKYDVKDA